MIKQDGFTLVEVIIGLALFSAALIIGVMVFAAIIRLHQQGQVARYVQQNGLYSMENIQRDVRNASAVTVDSTYNVATQNGSQNPSGTGNFLLLVGASQTSDSVAYIYCGDPSQTTNTDCSGRPTAILRYDYSQSGTCAGNKYECTDVSGQDVRIVNNSATAPLFGKSSTEQPFVNIHLEVQQAQAGLALFQNGYYDYTLDSTVEVRQ